MVEVNFYDNIDDKMLKFAVIISKTNGKWVFCKHKERDTLEVPGGHREKGETILETARRELRPLLLVICLSRSFPSSIAFDMFGK